MKLHNLGNFRSTMDAETSLLAALKCFQVKSPRDEGRKLKEERKRREYKEEEVSVRLVSSNCLLSIQSSFCSLLG
jgi:hypothetical protein